jgi:hypothetical protein
MEREERTMKGEDGEGEEVGEKVRLPQFIRNVT